MRLEIGSGVPVKAAATYPHMSVRDTLVWRAYIAQGDQPFDEVWYDVHVGTPMRLPAGGTDYLRTVADAVSRKRIDLVGRVKGVYFVIELKPVLSVKAIGQAIVYLDLFRLEFPWIQATESLVICSKVEVDVAATARDSGIAVVAMDGVLY